MGTSGLGGGRRRPKSSTDCLGEIARHDPHAPPGHSHTQPHLGCIGDAVLHVAHGQCALQLLGIQGTVTVCCSGGGRGEGGAGLERRGQHWLHNPLVQSCTGMHAWGPCSHASSGATAAMHQMGSLPHAWNVTKAPMPQMRPPMLPWMRQQTIGTSGRPTPPLMHGIQAPMRHALWPLASRMRQFTIVHSCPKASLTGVDGIKPLFKGGREQEGVRRRRFSGCPKGAEEDVRPQ